MNIIIHDSTGKILRCVSCPADHTAIQCRGGECFIEGVANDATQYVKDGAATPRPAMPAGVNGLTLSGIPAGAEIAINGEMVGTADGSQITFTFDAQGDYAVKAALFPYLDYEVTLHAD